MLVRFYSGIRVIVVSVLWLNWFSFVSSSIVVVVLFVIRLGRLKIIVRMVYRYLRWCLFMCGVFGDGVRVFLCGKGFDFCFD